MTRRVFFYCGDGNSLVDFRGHLIRKFQSAGYEVIANTPNIRQGNLKKLESWGVICIRSNIERKSINPLKSLIDVVKLTTTLRKFRPEILFSYTHKPVVIGAISGRFAGIKSIVSLITGTGHLFDEYNFKTKIRKKVGLVFFRLALTFSQKVIFQNPDNLDLFLQLRLVKEEKTSIVNGSGVDLDLFPFTPLPNNKRFLCLARLIKSKGILEYAQAAKELKKLYPEYSFFLGGPSDSHNDSISLDEIQRHWKEMYGINYIGNVEDPYEEIKNCDIYLLLSYNEGTPRSVLEALSVGRPIITTDVPGCRETVRHGENGYLVDVKNVASSIKYMNKIINDDLERMSTISREICENKYDVHKVNDEIFRILELKINE